MTEDQFDDRIIESAVAANLVQDVQLRRARRAQLIDRILLILVISVLLWVGLTNRATLEKSDDTLVEIQRQTSPEAIERQQRAVDAIVLTIDCNSRVAIQEVLDELVTAGVLRPGEASIVGEGCRR